MCPYLLFLFSLFVAALGLTLLCPPVAHRAGVLSSCAAALPRAAQALECVRSVVAAPGFSHPTACGISPEPWIKPASPGLQGQFSTPGPPEDACP